MHIVIDGKFVIPAQMLEKVTKVERVGGYSDHLFTPVEKGGEILCINDSQLLDKEGAEKAEQAEKDRLKAHIEKARVKKISELADELTEVLESDIARYVGTISDSYWIGKMTADQCKDWLEANPVPDADPES